MLDLFAQVGLAVAAQLGAHAGQQLAGAERVDLVGLARASPRMKPPAAATPAVAPQNIRKVMASICVALDRLGLPADTCQLVLVMKDTAVLNASSGACAALPRPFSGSTPCRRSTR